MGRAAGRGMPMAAGAPAGKLCCINEPEFSTFCRVNRFNGSGARIGRSHPTDDGSSSWSCSR